MKLKLLVMFFIAIMVTTVSYAYVVSQTRTNDVILKIGGPDVQSATLTALYANDVVLVPKHVTPSNDKEVKYLQFSLYVEADTVKEYTLDTELPPEISITTDRVGYTYSTGITYTITLELLEEVDYSTYTFYLYINFK